MIRLFIGLGLSEDAREALLQVISPETFSGQRSTKENYHITLAFLGMRDEAVLPNLEAVVSSVASNTAPFLLTVTGLDYFGNQQKALLHATIGKSAPLFALAGFLREQLTRANEIYDDKPLIPHITLARKANVPKELLIRPFQPIHFSAQKLTLFESTRSAQALRYKPLWESKFHEPTGWPV